jgi:GMP synthase-like glutamine amidotransferase
MAAEAVIILQEFHEHPGRFTEVFEERGLSVAVFPHTRLPSETVVADAEALVVMSGWSSAADPEVQPVVELVKDWRETDRPMVGVGLGAQQLALGAGARIRAAHRRETGTHDRFGQPFSIELTNTGLGRGPHSITSSRSNRDPIVKGMPKVIAPLFHLHGDTLRIPLGSEDIALVGRGNHVENQLIRVGEFAYGMQFHPELTREMLAAWVVFNPWLREASESRDIQGQFDAVQADYALMGDMLIHNFVSIVQG